jgi:hypothetical protein
VKHKSRLEKEKEAATERAATGTQGGKAKKNIAPSSGERQVRGLWLPFFNL